MKNNNLIPALKAILLSAALVTFSGASLAALAPLSEDELSDVSGQALFQTNKIVGTGSQATGTSGINFYRVGLDVELDMNMNIETLELGRTGPGPTDVDLWGDNIAFGCVADAGGNCVDSSSPSATQLKPVVLTRPYFEFAISGDGGVGREVVGIRLGAENINGPLNFGYMRVFSGYLTATAQLTLEGMTDVAGTCGAFESGAAAGSGGPSGGCPGYGNANDPDGLGNTGANIFSGSENCNGGCDFSGGNYISLTADPNTQYSVSYVLSPGYNGNRGALGLINDDVCQLGLCAQLAATTVNIGTASSGVLNALANGKRLTQALILQPGLGSLVDTAVDTLSINQCSGNRWNDGLACTAGDWFPALIRGPVKNLFKQQVCNGLSINPCDNNNLNNTSLPYNLVNFHRVDVNSANIGLSFQKQAIRYPGYIVGGPGGSNAVMQPGWSLYLPNAFFLAVSEPTAVFTNNISNGAAGQGDLVGLDPVYDNCWGAATFC